MKDELIGFTEFLCNIIQFFLQQIFVTLINLFLKANTGGLLGLFMGFSVVSSVEILYFISIRLYCRQIHYKKVAKQKAKSIDTVPNLILKNHVNFAPMKVHNHSTYSAFNRYYNHRGHNTSNTPAIAWKVPNQTAPFPYLD